MRFGKNPIKAPYLISSADFIACHQFNFLQTVDMLKSAKMHATFLINSPFNKDEVWDNFPMSVLKSILDKKIKLFVINASEVARITGMAGRINTIMQTCFFKLWGLQTDIS